ncbi:hypothetical protein ACH4ZX_38390 [Streptomyces sp. NPDC020490]|uniref:hypothetical protein n=1 Tax=Streptomyces sp. NPDC020490 TaxID=3365078 RepID=UPI0037907154
MSAATVHPAPSHSHHPHLHRIAEVLHAIKVFVGAAFSVAVLGEYGEDPGVLRK